MRGWVCGCTLPVMCSKAMIHTTSRELYAKLFFKRTVPRQIHQALISNTHARPPQMIDISSESQGTDCAPAPNAMLLVSHWELRAALS